MEKKMTIEHLIEKLLRMPESNIKFFLEKMGPEYVIQQQDEILEARREARYEGKISGLELINRAIGIWKMNKRQ